MAFNQGIEVITRAVVIHDSRILLCYSKDSPPIYYLPGGHLEEGETIEQCLKREFKEEVDVEVKDLKFWQVIENIYLDMEKKNRHELNLLFCVNLDIDDPMKIKSQEDHVQIKWLELKKLPDSKLLPKPVHQYLNEQLKKLF